jgi:hypothetical protein
MGYVRIRHSDDDLHRAARQHAFLEAIRDKVKSTSTFGKVPDLLNTVDSDVHRSNSLTMTQLITIANWARTVPKERVVMETMPSFEGYSYVTVDIPKAEQTVKRLFFDDSAVVTINAPGMSIVDSMTNHGRKGHKKGKGGDSAPQVSGSDEPLIPVSDGPDGMPADDANVISPPSPRVSPTPGTGVPSTGKDDGSKNTDGTKSGDGAKSGGSTGGADSGKTGSDQNSTTGDGNKSSGL